MTGVDFNCKAASAGCHITLYISFNKRHRLVSEGLVNLAGSYGARTQACQHHTPGCYPSLNSPEEWNKYIKTQQLPRMQRPPMLSITNSGWNAISPCEAWRHDRRTLMLTSLNLNLKRG